MMRLFSLLRVLVCFYFLMACQTVDEHKTATDTGTTVTELAIYRVTQAPQDFEETLLGFRQIVGQLDGYQDYLTLQTLQDSNIYLDVLHWDDLPTALAAAERVKAGLYPAFTNQIDSLIAYGEYSPYHSFHSKTNQNMPNKITEVVVYQIKADKVADYTAIVALTNQFLSTQAGFISREVLQDHQESQNFVDIVQWNSLEAAQAAMQAAQQEASLKPFFEATEQVHSFHHYQAFK